MTVTKQQQLEWLAKNHKFTNQHVKYVAMSASEIGLIIGSGTSCNAGLSINCHVITRQEWQQERDKMQKQQDGSLSKRGSYPPIGEQVELWFGGSFAYNCEFICMRGRNYIVWNLDADRPDCADIMNSEFRPLRTEREKAIDALIDIICAGGELSKDGSAANEIAERIYDAGMLKLPKPAA